MKITNIYFNDTEYKICRTEEKGLIILYTYENERPPLWLEYQMKLITWHFFDKKAEFGKPNRIDDYWYIPIYTHKKRIQRPSYKI